MPGPAGKLLLVCSAPPTPPPCSSLDFVRAEPDLTCNAVDYTCLDKRDWCFQVLLVLHAVLLRSLPRCFVWPTDASC